MQSDCRSCSPLLGAILECERGTFPPPNKPPVIQSEMNIDTVKKEKKQSPKSKAHDDVVFYAASPPFPLLYLVLPCIALPCVALRCLVRSVDMEK